MHPPTTETMYIGDKELKNTRENAVKQQRQVEGCHVPSLLSILLFRRNKRGSPLGADELKLRMGEIPRKSINKGRPLVGGYKSPPVEGEELAQKQ